MKYVFIDGANFAHTCRDLGIQIDYKKVGDWLQTQGIDRSYFFTAIKEEEDGVIPLQPLIDWLSYNGFTMITKPAKTYHNQVNGETVTTTKGNMDIEIAVTAMQLANVTQMEEAWFFTGDGDFIPLLQHLQYQGVKVYVVCSRKSKLLNDGLRRQADEFIEITEFNWEKDS